MKKSIVLSLLVLNLVCAVSFGAQPLGVTVDVPFGFVAAGKTLAPGHYSIERTYTGGQALLVIRDAEGLTVQTALCTSSVAEESSPVVEFIKQGEDYVLAVVKTQTAVFHLAHARETAKKLELAAK